MIGLNNSEARTVVYEAHHFVYRFCEQHYGQALSAWLHDKPKNGRITFFRKRGKKEPWLVAPEAPLCDNYSLFRVRIARPGEAARYREAPLQSATGLRVFYLVDFDEAEDAL